MRRYSPPDLGGVVWREESPAVEDLDLVAHAVFRQRVDGAACAGLDRGEQRREALLLWLLAVTHPCDTYDDTIRCHWLGK